MNNFIISEKKRLFLNILSAGVSFAITVFISFFFSPYVVRTLGVEANGFVQLANNFTSYIALITGALNFMAARFIAIESHKGNTEMAKSYYSSIFAGNLVLIAVFFVPMILCVIFLQRIISIPNELVYDVKALFTMVFVSFGLSTALSVWNVTFYTKNTLYIQSLTSMLISVLRVSIIVMMFALLTPQIWYISFAGLVAAILNVSVGGYFTKKDMPEMQFSRTYVKFKRISEVISIGIWRTVMSLGDILLINLDLLVCNLAFNATTMGVLALSKTVANAVGQLGWAVSYTFAPGLTKAYAHKDKYLMLKELRRGCKITTLFTTLPLAAIMAFGTEFYSLWIPGQDSKLLQTLSVLACCQFAFLSGTQPLQNIFNITGKLKTYSFVILGSGLLNIFIMYIFITFTDWGIYAIAGSSAAISILRNIVYTIPAAGRYCGLKKSTFFPELLRSLLCSAVLLIIGLTLRVFINADNWLKLAVVCSITMILGLVVNAMLILDKNEKFAVLRTFRAVIKQIVKV